MIAVDTNVLVRALVEDAGEPRQTMVARARLGQAKQVYVPQVVQVEIVWVLEAAYSLSKAEILTILDHLGKNAAFQLQNHTQFRIACESYRTGSAGFADYLILAESRSKSIKLLTFDKKLLKTVGTEAP